MRPFNVHGTTAFERILSDGLYAVFHRRWLEYFHEDQLLVVNGNEFCKHGITKQSQIYKQLFSKHPMGTNEKDSRIHRRLAKHHTGQFYRTRG